MAAFSPDRRELLQGLGIATLLATATPALAGGGGAASFVAIGDWGRDGQRRQSDVAVAMAQAAEGLQSRFVLSSGDNFYPAGVKSASDPQWKTSFEDIYSAGSLQTPWYVALGNHDYRGSVHAQVDYSRKSPRWRMPHRYFAIPGAQSGIPQLDIFVIDTTPMLFGFGERLEALAHGHVSLSDTDHQIAWLDRSLAQSQAPWKIVVGHHPIYSGGHHGDTPELLARVRPLLMAHGVQAYVNGHDHILQHIHRDGIDYICTGSGASAGFARPVEGNRFCGSRAGFAMFTLAGDTLNLEFRDFTGATLYRADLPRLRV